MLRSLLRSAPPHMHLTLATAYLNPTPNFLEDLQGWPGKSVHMCYAHNGRFEAAEAKTSTWFVACSA
eukprot:34940-Eustigmatos_ZCMA.PRE.1